MSEPAAVSAAELTVLQEPPELKELVDELCSAATKWYPIGLQLDVPDDTLDNIDASSRDDLGKALRRMLQEWRRREEPSWSAIVKVLQCPSVAEYVLAKNLQERYIGRASRHHTREKRRQPYQPSPASEDPRK